MDDLQTSASVSAWPFKKSFLEKRATVKYPSHKKMSAATAAAAEKTEEKKIPWQSEMQKNQVEVERKTTTTTTNFLPL